MHFCYNLCDSLTAALESLHSYILYENEKKEYSKYTRKIVSTSMLRSLSVMYNKARRLVMDTNRSSPTPLLSLQSIYFISCASFVFHQLHGNLPKSLRETPVFISDLAPYSLRSSNDVYIPPAPTIRSDFNPLVACQQV